MSGSADSLRHDTRPVKLHSRGSVGKPWRKQFPTISIITARFPGAGRKQRIDCWIYRTVDCVGRSSTQQSQSGTSNPSPTKSTFSSTRMSPLRNFRIISVRSSFGVLPSKCTAFGIRSASCFENSIVGQ